MNHRDAVEFVGILLLATCSLVFAALWWSAYITQNAVYMTIDQYGEATIEALVWFVAAPVMLYAVSSYLRRLAEDS